MMSDSAFPYGNDLNNPDAWAGLGMAKSKSWLIGYDSGFSLFAGGHTFLLFGKENLVACVATLYGIGANVSFGLSNAAKRVERGGGSSSRFFSGETVAKGMEKGKDAKDAKEWVESGDNLNSAVDIYKALHAQTNGMSALVPFSVNELTGTRGAVSGVAVDVMIGGATYYIVDALNLFKGAHAFNIKGDKTLVSAGIGSMVGLWRVKKWYSLWNELAHSKKAEYPFMDYDVHPFFRRWKSEEYAYQKRIERVDMQDRLNNEVSRDMQANPGKYGLPDKNTALQRSVEWQEEFQRSGRKAGSNHFLPWIDSSKHHLFDR